MTGISSASLRNWEKRYGFPQPERTSGGHRFYSGQDIEFLKKAMCLIQEGHPLPAIAEMYSQNQNSSPALEDQVAPLQEIKDDVTYRVELLYEALMKFDQAAIQLHYALLNAKLSPEQLFDRVFETLLVRMGSEWAHGIINIAQEHYASSFLRLKLASFLSIEFPATQPHLILAAALAEEKHEGGLLLVSAHLKFRGYPVSYFGIDLPVADLQSIIREVKPRAVTLSYFHTSRLKEDLPALCQLGVPVIVGGLALADKEALNEMKKNLKGPVHFCEKKVGSEAARFVELICQQTKKY